MWRRLVHVLVVSWPVAHAGVLVRSKTAQPEDELSMLKSEIALKDIKISELEKALSFANSKLHEMLRRPSCVDDPSADDALGSGASRRLETPAHARGHDERAVRDDPPSCSDEAADSKVCVRLQG